MTTPPQETQWVLDDPYDIQLAQINIHISLLPQKKDAPYRKAVLGISSHGDIPMLKYFENADELLARLPGEITALMTAFTAQLPERYRAHLRNTVAKHIQKKPQTRSPDSKNAATTKQEKLF